MRYFWIMIVAAGTMAAQQSAPRTPPAGPIPPAATDWPSYRRDHAGTGASPLTQIDARNVATLTQAWSYSLQAAAPAAPPGPTRRRRQSSSTA